MPKKSPHPSSPSSPRSDAPIKKKKEKKKQNKTHINPETNTTNTANSQLQQPSSQHKQKKSKKKKNKNSDQPTSAPSSSPLVHPSTLNNPSPSPPATKRKRKRRRQLADPTETQSPLTNATENPAISQPTTPSTPPDSSIQGKPCKKKRRIQKHKSSSASLTPPQLTINTPKSVLENKEETTNAQLSNTSGPGPSTAPEITCALPNTTDDNRNDVSAPLSQVRNSETRRKKSKGKAPTSKKADKSSAGASTEFSSRKAAEKESAPRDHQAITNASASTNGTKPQTSSRDGPQLPSEDRCGTPSRRSGENEIQSPHCSRGKSPQQQQTFPVSETVYVVGPLSQRTRPQTMRKNVERLPYCWRTVRNNHAYKPPSTQHPQKNSSRVTGSVDPERITKPSLSQAESRQDVEMSDVEQPSAQAQLHSKTSKRRRASLGPQNGCLPPQPLTPAKRPRNSHIARHVQVQTGFGTSDTSSHQTSANGHAARERTECDGPRNQDLRPEASEKVDDRQQRALAGQEGSHHPGQEENCRGAPVMSTSRRCTGRTHVVEPVNNQQTLSKKRKHQNSHQNSQQKTFSTSGHYYGIRWGREGFSGVTTSWDVCARYILGFRDAVYRMFDSWKKAEAFADRFGTGASVDYRSNLGLIFGRRRLNPEKALAQMPWEVENEPEVVSLIMGAAWLRFGMGCGLGGYSVFVSEYNPYNTAGLLEGHVTEIRLHLKATLEALEIVHQHQLVKDGGIVELYTVSEEVKNGLDHWLGRWDRTGKWTRFGSTVQNQDLWKAILSIQKELDKKGTRIQMIWVRGPQKVPAVKRANAMAKLGFKHLVEGSERPSLPTSS